MSTVSTGAPYGAAPPEAFQGSPPRRSRSLLRYAKWTDPAALLAWVLVTTIPNEYASIRYLLVAYFVSGLIVFYRDTLPGYLRGWPTLIVPVLCLISALWAPSAGEAFRKGLFLALTGTIAIYAASRLSVRQILACYFLGETLGAVLSLIHPNPESGNWTGVFGQKNYLAVHMLILYVTGLVILLDRESNRWLRMSTLAFIPLAAMLIILSKSATTFLVLGAGTAALLGHAFVWQPAVRVKHMRTFIVMSLVLLGLAGGLLLFGLFQFDAVDSVLGALGKDSTLTGRTFIWDWGHRIMREHPLTGVGANGFWRPEVGIANQITTYFFYEHFVKFSFHNSYLENGVQLGYPGYYATYFLAAWAVWAAFRTWTRNQTLLNAAFLIFAVMVIIRSNAEIDLALEFSGTATLFFIGATRKEDLRKPVQYAPPPAPPAAAPPQPGWRTNAGRSQ